MIVDTYASGARSGLVLAVLVMLAAAGGCAQRGQVVLRQEFAPAAQQELHLASGWTFTTVAQGRRDCLLAFPLPGARDGPRDFLLYASMPAHEGEFSVAAAGTGGVRGFLIQQVGRLNGKTVFVDGTARVRSVWLAPWRKRLDLALCCQDGTLIEGHAVVTEARDELCRFEQRYAADVALLTAIEAEEGRGSAATPDRGAASP